MTKFYDRTDAGWRMLSKLRAFGDQRPVVFGLTNGGVQVASVIAEALNTPFDALVVRKLGLPFQPEVAMGAVCEGGVRVMNSELVRVTGASDEQVREVTVRETLNMQRQIDAFRPHRKPIDVTHRLVLLVDDGAATGETLRAATVTMRRRQAGRIVAAVPVASPAALARLSSVADEVITLLTPAEFSAVGEFYESFTHVSDEHVCVLLDEVARRRAPKPMWPAPGVVARDEAVRIVLDAHTTVLANLTVPSDPLGVVVFAHGSGSSRHSARNAYVARFLNDAGIATLLVDLLSEQEEVSRSKVYDIDLLSYRLEQIVRWVSKQPQLHRLPIGLFGASTGSAAALLTAAEMPATVAAVVSRSGRVDLAGEHLESLQAPTLLVVGEDDVRVRLMNEEVQRRLPCLHQLVTIPGASHLFVEPGALHAVAVAAQEWFSKYFLVSLNEQPRRRKERVSS